MVDLLKEMGLGWVSGLTEWTSVVQSEPCAVLQLSDGLLEGPLTDCPLRKLQC